MVVTKSIIIPDDDELTVDEVNVSGPGLRAAAFHFGKYCEFQNNEFVLCRTEEDDPRKCINEGKLVTACTLEFFRKLKNTCADEFQQYANCLDKSSSDMAFSHCRITQSVFDKCVLDKLNIERPSFGYFCEAKIHDTQRPKPPVEPKAVYPDSPPRLPVDAEKPPARFGSRFMWMN